MTGHYDVIIVGLGAMGSAAAYHLAKRGRRVLGIDRFAPPHALGSSHGHTRIIREAYFEHPQYVPLVQRAYACWAALEQASGERLFEQTGGLMMGRPDSAVVAGARTSANLHGLPYEPLEAADIRRRYPAFRLPDELIGLLEPRAGMLFPERCIATHLRLAATHGATLRTNETVVSWQAGSDSLNPELPRATDADTETDGVTVRTGAGDCYRADHLVLSAGAWLHELVPGLMSRMRLEIERSTVFWFEPARHAAHFASDKLPLYILEYAPGLMAYGFPAREEGVKIALHHQGERLRSPDDVRRDVDAREIDAMRALLDAIMPDLNGRLLASDVCLYTNTPDEHFVIDAHPDHPRVSIVSPCSGHGFKFSSAIGEIVADLATGTPPSFDLSPFRLSRFL